MTNTSRAEPCLASRRSLLGLVMASALPGAFGQPVQGASMEMKRMSTPAPSILTRKQEAIGPIAANAAIGNMPRLAVALEQGFDAGLAINDAKEILVQLYAYVGFPRALNALAACMKVLDERRGRGIEDAIGREAGPVPTGQALLEAGTANQTALAGSPVKGPLFDFAPAIDRFLKAHLFGDIFLRDNLDWQSRELATVAALAALQGAESQLLSHIRISMNVGLTADQLKQFSFGLTARGDAEAGRRMSAALEAHLTAKG